MNRPPKSCPMCWNSANWGPIDKPEFTAEGVRPDTDSPQPPEDTVRYICRKCGFSQTYIRKKP